MRYILLLTCCCLAACAGDNKKDYAASARCQELGHAAGTSGYDQCMQDEKANQMLKQQREDFERAKQERDDWKLRRY